MIACLMPYFGQEPMVTWNGDLGGLATVRFQRSRRNR
jgi:hypothetical protein